MRLAAIVLICRLPGRWRTSVLWHLYGWSVAPSARIGLSLLDIKNLTMEDGAVIGHGNVFRGIVELRMESKSSIGQWNWVSSSEILVNHFGGMAGCLHLGPQSAITSRHYIDSSGGVTLGQFSVIGGVKSTILTHQIDPGSSIQSVKPVAIEDYCFIGSDCRIIAGVNISSRVIVAIGCVVTGPLEEEQSLYGGVPAKWIKRIDNLEYFERQSGWIGPSR